MRYFVPILAAAMAFTTACANDSTSPTVSATGTWNLRTLNGSTLPFPISSSTMITGEQLTLNNDGTYTDVATYSNGSYYTEYGYYTISGNAINFIDQTDNIQYQGSISGDVLTEFSGQYTSVFQKS
jgi:hypothetical protein